MGEGINKKIEGRLSIMKKKSRMKTLMFVVVACCFSLSFNVSLSQGQVKPGMLLIQAIGKGWLTWYLLRSLRW